MKPIYTLRLPEELRKKIKEESARSKMSINQYILYTLTKDITFNPYSGRQYFVTGSS